jgi:hypothetical protein
MSVEFKKELIELLKKHKVILEIDTDQDYSGIQDVKLVYHTYGENGFLTSNNELHYHNALNKPINYIDIEHCVEIEEGEE